DREFFFGREALVARLQEHLTEHPFLAILGPSGSGKSSLALAGLVPALQARSPGHRLAYLRPGSAPLTQLQSVLQEAGPGPLIVVADQFEELFTHTQDEAQRTAFLDLILAPVPDRLVVLTMRADFLGECAAYPALREAIQAHEELIAPMDGPDLRRAIDQQAGVVGLRFEAELSFTIVEDVQNEPGAMPLLQHALMELWKRRHGRWLRVAEYHAIGKVQQAIAHTADQLYAQSAPEEQARMRDVFVRLTRLGEEGAEDQSPSSDARRDTRRRVPLDELIPAGADPALTRALVQRLADTRLVVTDRNAALGRDEVELAHEALIRYWPRLRRWLNDDRTTLRLRDGILMAARDWQASAPQVDARDESLLVHRGTRLDMAWALLEAGSLPLNGLERDYVEACVALRQRLEAEEEARRQRELQAAMALAAAETRRADESRRSERRLRSLAGVLAVLAVVSALTAFFAFQQASLAELRGVAGPAVTQLSVRPETALLLGAVVSREARGAALLGGQVSLREARGLMLQQRAFSSSFGTFSSGHEGEVQAVAFSPTGDVYATAGRDRQIQLWDARTRKRRGEPLKGHENAVRALAFSPDGALLASGGADNSARLWEVATGRPRGEPLRDPALSDEVLSVAFHPRLPLLATGSSDHKVILWDLNTRKPAQEPLQGDSGWVESLAFDREGRHLAAGTRNSLVLVWDLERPQQPLFRLGSDRVQGHTGEVRAVAFKDSQYLVSGGQDSTVRVWDLASGQQVGYPIVGHSGWVEALSFSRDGVLASGSRDRTVSVWR
ncbi:MAG TPA: hypothetical protein VHQ00_13095, partial [Chloroflexota bacterium]|nr:hypothetical protein [Chloroflexota bacterium]